MYKGSFLFIFFWLSSLTSGAQSYILSGKITNSRMEPLPMVSIRIKDNPTATFTNNSGNYKLELPSGSYELLVTMVGYKSLAIGITLAKDSTVNILLEEESKALEEVVVRVRIKDKAEEIIRTLIQKKESILAAPGAYSTKVYIRATQQDSGFGKGKQSKKASREKPKTELDKMAMAEVLLHLDYESDNRIKEERLGVKKRGDSRQLFFLSATEGNFSLYHNLIKVPAISSMPFLSPVSYSGLVAYKLKTVKTDRIGKYKVYTISFKPRQLTNATVEGEMVVSDSSWSILYAKYSFPKYHLHEYEYFEVEQHYAFVQSKAWMLNRQQFTYFSRGTHAKFSGQTVASYTDYELNKQFSKQHFGSEVSSTNQQAYEKDSTFWQTVRKEPLSPKELRFIQYQDSIYRVTHSDKYLDSLERVINKITWKKIGVFGQSFYNREKDHYWHLPPVISLYQPVGFGGSRINITLSHLKTYRSRKNFSFFTNVSYGIRNSDINGSVSINRLYNPFSRGFYHISAGRDFQYIYEGDAWINMLKRNNIYLNNSIGAGHGLELANGLFFSSDLDMSFRRSVSDYKTSSVVDSVFGDVLKNNQAVAFEPYNALYGKLRLQYTPKQRYTREPREKIILGSRWPTFYAQWRKGIPSLLGSKVDFDYLEFGVEQQLNLELLGMTKYTVKSGSFTNTRDLRLIDYQFQRRGDPFLFMNPHRTFQAMDSTFPVFKRFYEGHVVHEFNGLILNKIPLLKKLQLREMAGAGFLFAKERNLRYAEIFTGVERAFQSPFNPLDKVKIGVYIVGSAANQFKNPVQFKVGLTTWDKRKNRWF